MQQKAKVPSTMKSGRQTANSPCTHDPIMRYSIKLGANRAPFHPCRLSTDVARIVAVLEWRNWQTHETQNLALCKQRGGSTPPSSTNIPRTCTHRVCPLTLRLLSPRNAVRKFKVEIYNSTQVLGLQIRRGPEGFALIRLRPGEAAPRQPWNLTVQRLSGMEI